MFKKFRKKIVATILLVLTMLSNLLPIFPMVQSLAVNNNDVETMLDIVSIGYPYKSADELGVSDWLYAYQATKMAVYCVLGQSNVDDFYATDGTGWITKK